MIERIARILETTTEMKTKVTDRGIEVGEGDAKILFKTERVNKLIDEIGWHETGKVLRDAVNCGIPEDMLKGACLKLFEFEWAKDRLFACVRPSSKKDDAVASEILDLGIEEIARVDLEHGLCAVVNSALLERWEVTEDEMFDIAEENTRKMSTVCSLGEMIGAGSGDPVKVLSTERGMFGAGAICDVAVMDEIHKSIGDFYVIPSSIHEVLILPEGLMDVEGMKEMVVNVNRDVVNDEDVLSNDIYMYDGLRLRRVA